jgi:hypothetical protein
VDVALQDDEILFVHGFRDARWYIGRLCRPMRTAERKKANKKERTKRQT